MPVTKPPSRLVVILASGAVQRIECPADAKVTFGAVQPGGRTPMSYAGGNHLRIYRGSVQLAVIPNVIEFYDEAMLREKLVSDVAGNFGWQDFNPEDQILERAAEKMANPRKAHRVCSNCGEEV